MNILNIKNIYVVKHILEYNSYFDLKYIEEEFEKSTILTHKQNKIYDCIKEILYQKKENFQFSHILKSQINDNSIFCCLFLNTYNKEAFAICGRFNYIEILSFNRDYFKFQNNKDSFSSLCKISTESTNEFITEVSNNNNSYLVCCGHDLTIKLLNLKTFKFDIEIFTMSEYSKMVCEIDLFSCKLLSKNDIISDKNTFYLAACFAGCDKTIKIYEIIYKNEKQTNLQPIFKLTGHKMSVYCLVYENSKHILISGSFDKTIIIWCLSKKEILKQINFKNCFSTNMISISSNYLIVSLSKNNGLACLNLNTYNIFYSKTSNNIVQNTTWTIDILNKSTKHEKSNILVSSGKDANFYFWNVDLKDQKFSIIKKINLQEINFLVLKNQEDFEKHLKNEINYLCISKTNDIIYTVGSDGIISVISLI